MAAVSYTISYDNIGCFAIHTAAAAAAVFQFL
jgi:hypothetical protein